MVTTQQTVTSCPGGGEGGGGGGGGGSEKTLPYAATTSTVEEVEAQEVEVEVDEVKMEAEEHLAREYVQEFVLDHLDPADVKREVSAWFFLLDEYGNADGNISDNIRYYYVDIFYFISFFREIVTAIVIMPGFWFDYNLKGEVVRGVCVIGDFVRSAVNRRVWE